jgi:nuclear GTP-binding protein
MRVKVQKKVAESKRKQRRDAKRDPTWRSNAKNKDPGVPNLFPYKDQLLAEAREARVAREEAKKIAKVQQAEAAADENGKMQVDEDGDKLSGLDEDEDEDEEGGLAELSGPATSSSLRAHVRSLRAVIERSDVIIHVLDARDPEGTRSRAVEREVLSHQGKRLVLVLNKIGAFGSFISSFGLSITSMLTVVDAFQTSFPEKMQKHG